MFEVGCDYEFHVVEDSSRGSGVVRQVWTVEAIDGNLLKFSNPHEKAPEILNTASCRFEPPPTEWTPVVGSESPEVSNGMSTSVIYRRVQAASR